MIEGTSAKPTFGPGKRRSPRRHRAAGPWAPAFAGALLLFLAAPAEAQNPSIAVTVDDLPAHGPLPPGETRLKVAAQFVAALSQAKAPAIGFVSGSFGANDPDGPKVLALWKAAKLPLGSHTFSHPHLSQVGAAAFITDIDRNAPFIQGEQKVLRYPYLDEGRSPAVRDEVRKALAKRGYRIAAVTLSFDDYAYNDVYVRCLAQHDEAAVAKLEKRFLDSARLDAERGRAISKAMLGRDIPQVLLLHIGAFTTKMLPRLLAQYREMGFAFTTLDAAQKDPFYAAAVNPSKPGPSPSLDPLEKKMDTPLPDEPSVPGNEVCPAK